MLNPQFILKNIILGMILLSLWVPEMIYPNADYYQYYLIHPLVKKISDHFSHPSRIQKLHHFRSEKYV